MLVSVSELMFLSTVINYVKFDLLNELNYDLVPVKKGTSYINKINSNKWHNDYKIIITSFKITI